MEIKAINPKLKRSEIAKVLATSTPTLQQYRIEIKLLSHFRIPPSTNTHTRKQKTSNDTQLDLKMT